MSLNLASILRSAAREQPNHPALIHEGSQLSYGALDLSARRLAAGLLRLGLRPGEHVALLLPNVPAFSIAYFGCHYAACPVVPLNVLFTADDLVYHLGDADAVAVITFARLVPRVEEAVKKSGRPIRILVAGAADDPIPPGAHAFSALLEEGSPVEELPATMPDDTAVLLYTSGTTGRPKGAELTHFNMYYNAECVATHVMALPRGTVALTAVPLFHSMGQTGMHNAVLRAMGTIVLMPRFEPRAALSLMKRHGVTLFGGVPTMYSALLNEPDGEELRVTTLTSCMSGGASLPVEVMRRFEERFGVAIQEGYGLSETSPAACFAVASRPRKPGSIARPLHGVEVRLERPDGTVVSQPHEPGEICIKGHNVMKGYYKRPDETRAAIRNGWFHSGDIGTFDEDGDYRIVDRIKDIILRGGYNVYPREVEEALYAHEDVVEAAVVGVASDTQGEEVKAFVVLRPGATTTEQDLISHCRKRLAVFKYPRIVEIRSELPKGPTGKILKQALRQARAGDPETAA